MKSLSFNEKIKELKRGADEGFCRICGEYSKLSDDHVPPKSCGNKDKIEIVYGNNKFISQNGLTCKTICEKCNNTLLGRNYDKELETLYKEISTLNKSDIIFGKIKVKVNVRNLVRCLLGHLLAICAYDKEKTVQEILKDKLNNNKDYIFTKYRKFVLGETDYLIDTLCYYWYYPYNNIVINPLFVKADVLTGPKILDITGTIIKFFPIALYLVNTEKSSGELPLNILDLESNYLVLNKRENYHRDFPETPSKNELIMLNSGGSFDIEKKKN